MAMDIPTLRKLVALDENDPLSHFALGKKLFELQPSPDALTEAVQHLRFANERAPEHLATYHILGQALIQLGETDQARRVLQQGRQRAIAVGEGMGRDLAPAMQKLIDTL